MEFLFNLINDVSPNINTFALPTNNGDVEIASMEIKNSTEDDNLKLPISGFSEIGETAPVTTQQTNSKPYSTIADNLFENSVPIELKSESDFNVPTADTTNLKASSNFDGIDVHVSNLLFDISNPEDIALDADKNLEDVKMEVLNNENLNPHIPTNDPYFGMSAAVIAYKLEDDIEFQKRYALEPQPISFSYNNLPEPSKKRTSDFSTPSPKKRIIDDEVFVRKSPQLVISSDSSSVSTVCEPDDLYSEDLPLGSILETRSQTNFVKPPKRNFKKWIPVIPTIRDKFIKLITPLVDINKSSNSVVCYACNATIPLNQKAIFPHIRNCVNIHCFRKWMFNFDAVKYQVAYAKDESWQSRWNNTKILVKNLEFKGLHGYLLQYFKKVNMDYECNGCMHMCFTLDEEDTSLVYLKLLSHMLSCSYSVFDLYLIMEELYNMSLHSPIVKKVKTKVPRLLAQPMHNNSLDGGKGQEQRIEMLKLQIANKKQDLEMYKEYNKVKCEQLELETVKIQEEIKLKIITYLSGNGNNKTLAKLIKRISEE